MITKFKIYEIKNMTSDDATNELVSYLESKSMSYYRAKKAADKKKISSSININKVKNLINSGADINARDSRNNYGTLLGMAAYVENFDLVKILVEKGADVNTFNSIEVTPLYMGCNDGNFEIVKFLVENGADINLCNDSIVSPLKTATYSKHWKIAIYLLKKGANINNLFLSNVKNLNSYSFQKAFVELHPNEFVNNMDPDDIHKRIKKEYPWITDINKYNL